MAALRSYWDPPYWSHHQQLVQPRRSPGDLPEQRRSRGVRTYDQPQPPHQRGMPSRLEIPQQHTYKQPPHYSGVGRYEQLIDLLDAATSRLESRCEEIDRRVTKLQASKAAYRQQPYADIDSRLPKCRPTGWDPPSRTSGRHVGEMRAHPLPEPPPQPVPDLLYGPCGDTLASKHKTRSSFGPSSVLHVDSAAPSRFPLGGYTGQQRDCQHFVLREEQQPHTRRNPPHARQPYCWEPHTPPPMRSDRPPKQPSAALPKELPPSATPGAYRPLQPPPVTAPILAANPHPQAGVRSSMINERDLLDDVLSPPAMLSSSCNPNISGKEKSLLEAGVARERKTIEEKKSTAITKETNLINGDENGLMDEFVNCLHEVSYPSVMVCALTGAGSDITREVEGREKDVVWYESIVKVGWKENAKGPKGLVVGKGGAVSDIFKMITLIPLYAFDPGIFVSFSKRNCEFLATQLAEMDLCDENEKLHIDTVFGNAMNMLSDNGKERPHEGFIKCLFATETCSLGLNMPAKPVVFTNAQKFDGDDERRSPIWFAFDPGEEASPKLLLSTVIVASWFPP